MNEWHSTDAHLEQAISRYSSLFTFPTYRTLVALLFSISTVGSMGAFAVAYLSVEGLYAGFIFGLLVLALPTTIADALTRGLVTKEDVIFNLRRCTALSLVACGLWVFILVAGSFLQLVSGCYQIVTYASFFGMGTTLSLRFLTFSSVSLLDRWRIALSSVMQPLLCFMPAILFWDSWSLHTFLTTLLSSCILLIATCAFIRLVDKRGERAVGIGSISLLKGFAADWIENLPSLLEDHFEKLGSDADISIALLAFRCGEAIRALMVIPTFHPGPFRNLGSSGLPHSIQLSLEEKFGAITAVLHGTSGHELDLASQLQCETVLQETLRLADFLDFSSKATRLIRTETSSAKAACQIFGECALVTVTRAPKKMEDIPLKIGLDIISKGVKLGVGAVVVVDAHNSIGGACEAPVSIEEVLQALQTAAESAVATALNEPRMLFKIGVAKVMPPEFDIVQGMGPGGIIALVVVVGGQTSVYVVIDGNNMISGLRERVLESLRDLGIDDGEVLTTDTHVVNAVTLTERGYHPVGEAIDQEKLISHIRRTVAQALDNVKESEVSWKVGEVHKVRTIGEEGLIALSFLVDSVFRLVKRLAFVIYVPATLLAILPFILL